MAVEVSGRQRSYIFSNRDGYSHEGYRREFNTGRSGRSDKGSEQRYETGNKGMFGGFCSGELTGSATVVGRRVILDPSVGSGKRTRDPDQLDDSIKSVLESKYSSDVLNKSLINVAEKLVVEETEKKLDKL